MSLFNWTSLFTSAFFVICLFGDQIPGPPRVCGLHAAVTRKTVIVMLVFALPVVTSTSGLAQPIGSCVALGMGILNFGIPDYSPAFSWRLSPTLVRFTPLVYFRPPMKTQQAVEYRISPTTRKLFGNASVRAQL